MNWSKKVAKLDQSYLFRVLTSNSAANKAFSLSSNFWVVITLKKEIFFLLENRNYKIRPAPPWSCPARPPTGSTSSSTRPPPPRPCSTSPAKDRCFFGFEILFEKILVLENLGRLCKLLTLVRSVHRIVFLHLRRKRSAEETIEIIFILDLNCIN